MREKFWAAMLALLIGWAGSFGLISGSLVKGIVLDSVSEESLQIIDGHDFISWLGLAEGAAWLDETMKLPIAYAAEEPASMEEPTGMEEMKVIPTTAPAVAFTFAGLSNKAVVKEVLTRLQSLGIRATFFVFEQEIKAQPDTVRQIIAAGHEVGLAIRPKSGETEEQTYQSILHGRRLLKERFGIANDLVKQPWGRVSEETKAAVARTKGVLVGQTVNVVQSKHKNYQTAEQVLAEIFGKAVFSLGRGQIVHFRLDFYTKPLLVIDLISLIKEYKIDNVAYAVSFDNPAINPANDSQYVIKPVGEILQDKKKLYHYPVDVQQVPENLRSEKAGAWYKPERFFAEASKRYVGNHVVNDEDRMLGFSKSEVRRMDQTGLIHTTEPLIFLTFDDWGHDSSINKLLYVLRKHKVSATFFVITHNVLANPNLLRAMAEAGNTIGSHSDMHKAMAVRDASGRQVPTQSREEYFKDLTTSYQKLRDVIGDVTVGGKPMLARFFRPPTLAVSKMGMETLFATGFEYVVSGSCSTEDYQAEGVGQLVNRMREGVYDENGRVRKGAVLVMHMTEAACYTPIALDILLTANEKKTDTDLSKFRVANLADYLTTGYKQFQMQDEP